MRFRSRRTLSFRRILRTKMVQTSTPSTESKISPSTQSRSRTATLLTLSILNRLSLKERMSRFKVRRLNFERVYFDIGNSKQATKLNSDGGALQCFNCISFFAESLNVQDSKAMSGGAISFE
jgi:hypothetical protein